MIRTMLILGLSILFTHLSWGMEELDGTDRQSEIINTYIAEMSAKIQYLQKQEQEIKHNTKNEGPDKIDLRTISGDDWFVVLGKTIILNSNTPVFIPQKKWLKYNCEIYLEEHYETGAKITIAPDVLPCLGDCELPDASWKAVVWLEALEDTKQQQLLTEVALPQIQKSLAEYSFCKDNLEKEKQALMRKLTRR